MTGDDFAAAATTYSLPDIGSSGVIAGWNGAIEDLDGSVICHSPLRAASLALARASSPDQPLVMELSSLPSKRSPVVPWSAVRVLHLPSVSAAREYEARAYSNFDPRERPVVISPDLFGVAASPVDSRGTSMPAGFDMVIRGFGAASCVAAVPVPQELADTRDQVVMDLVGAGGTPSAFTEALSALLTSDPEDLQLMTVLVDMVAKLDPGLPVGGRRLVGELSTRLPSAGERVNRGIEAVLEVLRSRRELPSLRNEVGLRSVKSMLLFTLRPDPAGAVAWFSEMRGDPQSVVVAAALAGLRSGWTRLPIRLRGGPARRGWFERQLADTAGSVVVWSDHSEVPVGELLQGGSLGPSLEPGDDGSLQPPGLQGPG